MGRPVVTMEVGEGVAVITMFNPPVNSLSQDVMMGVYASFKEAHNRNDVKAIVLTGAGGQFSGGADIGAMQKRKETNSGANNERPFTGVELMNDIFEGGPKPVVAAIEKFALGGGLELAMGCHARLAAPKARLALPELQLGIIPGLGGTQRLPRLVGVKMAIDMMLTSKFIPAEEALKAGLVDAVVPPKRLLTEAQRWALDIAAGRKPWNRSLTRTDHLGSDDETFELIKEARLKVKRMSPNVPHPSACLDAIEAGFLRNPYFGTVEEHKISQDLQITPTAKGLMHAFFSERSVLKVPGITDQGLKARPIRIAGIVGGGLMGSGIATALALHNVPVVLKEVNSKALDYGMNLIKANIETRAEKGGFSAQKLQSTLALVKGTLDYRDFKDVDIVIEAVFESVELKQSIFQDLEKHCKPDCILATNTSNILLGDVGAKTPNSYDRIVGTHFFSPAHVMPLLELVRSRKTSPQVLFDLIKLGKVLGKTPIVVENSVGFAVNRVFFPYSMCATFLATELGVHPYRIDKILKKFGMPMGPFRVNDMAGVQLESVTKQRWSRTFPDRAYRPEGSTLDKLLVEKNRLGEKTGKGYYNYPRGSRTEQPAPELEEIIAECRKARSLRPDLQGQPLSDQDVLELMLFPVVNEATRVLEERVVLRSSDLDLSSILGRGFPRYRGGIVFWGDLVGAKHIHSQLSKWADLYQSSAWGDFFKPSASLERVVKEGISMKQILEYQQSRL
ncbi:unnamed protein product [Calypogeia fissa]